MVKHLLIYLFSIVFTISMQAQIALSGPMQGYSTDSTTNIWMLVKQNQLPLSFELQNNPNATIAIDSSCHKKWCTYNLNIQGVSTIDNQLKISDGINEQLFSFKSSNKNQDSSFSFLVGSCTFRWGPFLPLVPGNGYKIFEPMSEHETDLMLWLGDNVYYLLRDHRNEAQMFRENVLNRKNEDMSGFIQSKQHYAIWDDHDFGPNNSDGNYEKKESTKNIFDDFWANPPSDKEGNYYSFQYANSEFFMLDSRWFKTDSTSLLGEEQLQWLINGLKNSKSTFKFVALGSQIINPKGLNHERFAEYKSEYNKLLETAAKLENVVFLSGDMHYSTMFKNEDFGKPLYEFSCSPLSAMRYKIGRKNDEYDNPYYVEGTQYNEQNFGKVTVNGNQCIFEVFDNEGNLVWRFEVP